MCDENSDNVVMYVIKDCDSVENEEFQALDEEEEQEDETQHEQHEYLEESNDSNNENANYNDYYILPTDIEALDDEDIPPEVMLQPIKEIPEANKRIPNIKEENLDDNEGSESNGDKVNLKKTYNGPERYLLFDDLIASVVDYDKEGTPIVQFSMPETLTDSNLPVECGICPDVMKKTKLAKHLKTHLVSGTNRYKCIYCDETYKDYKYLASHARRHMGIRPYVCEICKIYFSTKQDMRVHNQRRHQEKEHICEICGKTFSQNTMLKRHRESTHEKKRRFQCEHCPKAYYKNFSLQEHVRSVHMGQRRMLKCPFCGMQCLDAHKMARHRKLWHLNQNQFECEICKEKFTNVHYFDAHKRSIQCRNNTRRKMDEEKQENKLNDELKTNEEQKLAIKDTERKIRQQQNQQELLEPKMEDQGEEEEEIIEPQQKSQPDTEEEQWQLVDDPSGILEVYDGCDQYVVNEGDLLESNQALFHQEGDVLFEIIFDPDQNELQC